MKNKNNKIIKQIRDLLDELEGLTLTSNPSKIKIANKKTRKKPVGCIGVIEELIDDNFFQELKNVSDVVNKLKEEGQPYSKELVSMNLLNLVKPPRRTLRRVKENKQWGYIVRA